MTKAERMKAWRVANRERLREYNREWLAANKERNAEKAIERSARYYQNASEEILARKRERYTALSTEQRREYSGFTAERKAVREVMAAEWRKRNPGKVNAQTAKRRAALIRATPAWASADQIRLVYEMAADLQLLCGTKLHVDHIVPLRGKNVCGLHVQNNLRVFSAAGNRAKGAKHAGW